MADAQRGDQLNDIVGEPPQAVYARVQKNGSNIDENPPPPHYAANFIYNSQAPERAHYDSPRSVTNSMAVTSSRNPFEEDLRQSLPAYTAPPTVEQKGAPQRDHGQDSSHHWTRQASQEYQGQVYGDEQGMQYDETEYYDYEAPRKKKNLSHKIDRLVQRFPALGVFYKQPPSTFDRSDSRESASSSGKKTAAYFAEPPEFNRELSADELGLYDRYSNTLNVRFIDLQGKDQTQPVDVRVQSESDHIYLCDVGRSVVEIFDLHGARQHVIDDPVMSKFQPTALVMAFDGTIIVASHFNHSLHMYTPTFDECNGDSNPVTNPYKYQQFKLGGEGNQLHQFFHPAGITIDPRDGYLYVCDRGNYRIKVLSPQGICERVVELAFKGKKKQYLDPSRIACQTALNQLVCIVGTGDAICFFSQHASGRTYVEPLCIIDENGLGLEGASGLAVDAEGRIFIADTGHNRIVICRPEGDYITSFGTTGDGPGQLKRPCGLDLTSDGTVVVADAGNKRLQMFGCMRPTTLIDPISPTESVNNLVRDLGIDEAVFL